MKPLTYTEGDPLTCSAQSWPCKWLLPPIPCHCNTHMSQDHRQSPLKALLNTFGMYKKTHTMTTRYGSHDTEDIPATQDSVPLDIAPLCQEETMNHLMNTMKKLTLAVPWVNYENSSSNLKTNLPAWNLPLPNLHLWQSWCSSLINCSISLWCSKHIQPPA